MLEWVFRRMKTIIQFDHVHYSYHLSAESSILAVKDISFSIVAGDYVAIIGANGSGKTTLAKLMNGLLLPDEGQVLVMGHSTGDRNFQAHNFSRIGLVFQNARDQIVASLVEEDTAFGPENLALPREQILARVDRSLKLCGADHLRGRQTYLLSAGETQRVALAGVLAMQPDCLIFDETTAMLDPSSRRDLLNLMRDLNQQGYTIVHITHDLDEVLDAKRVFVMNEGELVMDDKPAAIFKDEQTLPGLHLGIPFLLRAARDLQGIFPALSSFYARQEDLLADLLTMPRQPQVEKQASSQPRQSKKVPAAVVRFNHVSHTYMLDTPLSHTALHDLTFSLAQELPVGLIGHTGSGKSTVLQHINGLLRPQQGSVESMGFDLSDTGIDIKTLRSQVGLVFQNPEAQFFETYVGDEIAYAARMLGYQGKLRDLVRASMQTVGLDFETFVDRPLHSLSGGQKRRVALASYLVTQPDMLLLDEPFAGLDPVTHQEMLDFVKKLNRQGKMILVSTHNMRDLLELTQRVLVLYDGNLVYGGSIPDLFEREELPSWGMEIPLEIQVAKILRQRGWQLPRDLVGWQEMIAWLRQNAQEDAHAVL